jgi:hypothetical protein
MTNKILSAIAGLGLVGLVAAGCKEPKAPVQNDYTTAIAPFDITVKNGGNWGSSPFCVIDENSDGKADFIATYGGRQGPDYVIFVSRTGTAFDQWGFQTAITPTVMTPEIQAAADSVLSSQKRLGYLVDLKRYQIRQEVLQGRNRH